MFLLNHSNSFLPCSVFNVYEQYAILKVLIPDKRTMNRLFGKGKPKEAPPSLNDVVANVRFKNKVKHLI